ncbi:hypothetical protein [Roseibium sp.]|uniref:hypothetical protein n=1 Tax=Roseibium sp. TaxID=1936156 RepID=UPI003D1347DC
MRPDVKSWDDDENCTYLDEYDPYLANAAGRLRNGVPEADVVSYLVEIETEHMGLGLSETTIKRAEEVVTAMRTDERLWVD